MVSAVHLPFRHVWPLAATAALLSSSSGVHADQTLNFGLGAHSVALAQADVAAPELAYSAFVIPSLVSSPGTHVSLGGTAASEQLSLNDSRLDNHRTRGSMAFGWQSGWQVSRSISMGGGVSGCFPMNSASSATFRPASEPVFYRFDAGNETTHLSAALAVRWRSVALGLGAVIYMSASSTGTARMTQDTAGPHTDGDVKAGGTLHAAPSIGLSWSTSAFTVAARATGAQHTDISAGMQADVRISGNPLNGTSSVLVRGTGRYVPATIDIGVAWKLYPRWTMMASARLARWSQAPSPFADNSLTLNLGMNPDIFDQVSAPLEAHDTMSVRAAIEGPVPWTAHRTTWRIGTGYEPSALTAPRGWTTVLDTNTISVTGGLEAKLGTWNDTSWHAALGMAWTWLQPRSFVKSSPVVPFAQGDLAGYAWLGAFDMGAQW